MDTQTYPTVPVRRRSPLEAALGAVAGLIATLLGLIVLAWAVLFVTKGRFLKPTFVKFASKEADRPVSVDGDFQLYFNPFHLKFLAEGLTLANPAWAHDKNLFTARSIDAEISTWDLIFGRQHVLFLTLDGANAGLEIDKAGRNTWTFAGNTPFKVPPIDRASITGSVAHFIDAKHQADVHMSFGDLAGSVGAKGNEEVAGPLTFKGGGTALGAPFTVHGAFTSPNSTIAGGSTSFELHSFVAATNIDVSGTVPSTTRIDGADLHVIIAGKNLQTLFKLAGANAPATRPYKLSSNFTKDGPDYKFTNIAGRFGDSDLAGSFTVGTGGPRTKLVADLHTKVLDVLDIGPWLGYAPDKLDKQGGKGAITYVDGHPRIIPDQPIDISSLKAFDASVKYRAGRIDTGTVPITNLGIDLTLYDRHLQLHPVALDMLGGRITADVDLDAQQEPIDAAYDIRTTAIPIGKLLTSFKVEENGTTANIAAHIKLAGSGDSIHQSLATSNGRIAIVISQGLLWVRNIEAAKLDIQNFVVALVGKDLKKPREIRCGVIAFTVADGVARTDPVLFDTDRAVYSIKGQFAFPDESIGLSLRGRSKEISLFSGQAPIGIGGYFAAPTYNLVSKTLVARAGASIALGVVATPVAAILPFVDLGTAKNTNCAAVQKAETEEQVEAAPHDPKTPEQKKHKKVLGIF